MANIKGENMEKLEEKTLRQEIVKVEVDLRRVKNPEKLLQQLKETLKEFGVDKQSLELIPIFFPKKKWAIPQSTFIAVSVPKDTSTKLRLWRHSKDRLIIDANDGELLILNETKLDEWHFKQKKKEQNQQKGEIKNGDSIGKP